MNLVIAQCKLATEKWEPVSCPLPALPRTSCVATTVLTLTFPLSQRQSLGATYRHHTIQYAIPLLQTIFNKVNNVNNVNVAKSFNFDFISTPDGHYNFLKRRLSEYALVYNLTPVTSHMSGGRALVLNTRERSPRWRDLEKIRSGSSWRMCRRSSPGCSRALIWFWFSSVDFMKEAVRHLFSLFIPTFLYPTNVAELLVEVVMFEQLYCLLFTLTK